MLNHLDFTINVMLFLVCIGFFTFLELSNGFTIRIYHSIGIRQSLTLLIINWFIFRSKENTCYLCIRVPVYISISQEFFCVRSKLCFQLFKYLMSSRTDRYSTFFNLIVGFINSHLMLEHLKQVIACNFLLENLQELHRIKYIIKTISLKFICNFSYLSFLGYIILNMEIFLCEGFKS